MRDFVATDAAACDQQMSYVFWHQRPIGNVEIAPGSRQNQQPIPVDELRKDADGVVDAALLRDNVPGEVVERLDLAGVTDSERHPEIPQLRVLAARHEAA